MSTRPPRAAPASSGVVRQLLVLQPYHYAYLAGVLVLTLGGLSVSLIWGTHIQNLASTFPVVPQKDKSYWANKHNVFNQVFVKYAMIWNWLVFFLQLVALKTTRLAYFSASPVQPEEPVALEPNGSSSSVPSPETGSKKDDDVPAQEAGVTSISLISMSLIRFVAATFLWLLFASWFFGPSIISRILVATGGHCVPVEPKNFVGTLTLPKTVDHSYCAQRKAYPLAHNDGVAGMAQHALRTEWRGGHDVSGHTFLLILSLLWMLEEVSPLIPYLVPALQGLYPRSQWWPFNFRDARARPRGNLPPPQARGYTYGLLATLGLAALWAWMLLQTQIYYHTLAEKVSGLLAGVAAWLLLPKGS